MKKFLPEVLILGIVYFFFLNLTFHIGPDPVVDSGREAYVPLAILNGKILYKDIFYFNGPFSPYLNAFIFSFVEFSIQSWKVVNSVLLTLITASIWFLIYLRAGRLNAFLGTLAFIPVFGLQVLPYGYMNDYLTPYSHEMTHSLLLSLWLFICLDIYIKSSKSIYVLIMGIITALLFLMKPEFFLAALAIPFYLCIRCSNSKIWKAYITGFLVIVIIPFIYFSYSIDLLAGLKSLVTPWSIIFTTDVRHNHFYRQTQGTFYFWANLQNGLEVLLSYLLFIAGSLLSVRYKPFALITLGIFTYAYLEPQWYENFTLGLPYLFIGLLTWHYIRDSDKKWKFETIFILFSLLLLAKIFFKSFVYGYGFALTVPAFLSLFLFNYTKHATIKWTFIYISLFFTVMFGYRTTKEAAGQRSPISFEEHYFTLDSGFGQFSQLLEMVDKTVPPTSSLLVFPEGLLINVLTQRVNPVKSTNFMPPEFDMFGEQEILQDIKEGNPDFILLVDYQYRPDFINNNNFFSGEYAQEIAEWIHDNYNEIRVLQDKAAIYTLLKRK